MQTLNLRICGLWIVVSQEFAHFTQEFHTFHSNQSFTFQSRVRRPILWRWQLRRVGRAWRMGPIDVGVVLWALSRTTTACIDAERTWGSAYGQCFSKYYLSQVFNRLWCSYPITHRFSASSTTLLQISFQVQGFCQPSSCVNILPFTTMLKQDSYVHYLRVGIS